MSQERERECSLERGVRYITPKTVVVAGWRLNSVLHYFTTRQHHHVAVDSSALCLTFPTACVAACVAARVAACFAACFATRFATRFTTRVVAFFFSMEVSDGDR